MARFLHEMNEAFKDRQDGVEAELRNILGDLGYLRSTSRRDGGVFAHVLPDGRVQLSTGEIVEGVRGAPGAADAKKDAPVSVAENIMERILDNVEDKSECK
jgi:hypothetical protein